MKLRQTIGRYFDNISIFKKLMVSFLFLALIPVIAIGSISYALTYHTMHRDIAQSMAVNQQRIETTLNAHLDTIDSFLSEEIYRPEFQRLVRGVNSGLITMGAVAEACNTIATEADLFLRVTEAFYIPSPHSGTDRLENATPEDYRLTVTKQGDALFFTKAVCNLYTEQILGELTISISLFSFLDEYLQMDKEEYGFLLFDRNGDEIFANWNIAVDTGRPTSQYMHNQTGTRCTVNGIRYIFSVVSFPTAEWELYCFVPQRLVEEQLNAILLTTATTVLVCIVGVVLLSLAVAYSMTHRLNIMVNRMRNYRVDDAHLPGNHDLGGDEIGQLAVIFDRMEQRNAVLIQEVYESKLEQKETELRALQAQIKPHFLYNCLDNINIRALMLGDGQISEVVTMLADFYRTSLNKGQSATSVGNEIKNVKTYLSLLTAMGGKFRVEYDIDPDVEQYTLISLALQPIVENAYQHGAFHLGPNGLIRLSIKKAENELVVSVFNNGTSITPEQARIALEHSGRGYGLKNVNTRLQLFFGREYGVKIGAVEGGTECVVTIPAILYQGAETLEEP